MIATRTHEEIRDLIHDLRNPDPNTLWGAVEFCREHIIPRLEAMLSVSTSDEAEGAAIAAEWKEARQALDTITKDTAPNDAEQIEERFAKADHALLAYRGFDCMDVVRLQAEQCKEALTDEAEGEGRELDAIERCLIANSFALASLLAQTKAA